MLELNILKTKIQINFSFFAIIALICVIDDTYYISLGILACMLHELGHIFFMTLFGIAPKSVVFYGAGIKIVPSKDRLLHLFQDITILIAGSLTNFIISGISFYLGRYSDEMYIFSAINLLLGTFNLLPYRTFDGGKIIEEILSTANSRKAYIMRKVFGLLSIIGLILLFLHLFYQNNLSISLAITIFYIILSEIYY